VHAARNGAQKSQTGCLSPLPPEARNTLSLDLALLQLGDEEGDAGLQGRDGVAVEVEPVLRERQHGKKKKNKNVRS